MELSESDRRAVDLVAARLSPSSRLLFITGAGLSADSGLPTYRGVGGLYADGRGTPEGFEIEEALSGAMLRSRPEITWRVLCELEQGARGARPNRGHEAIAEMGRHFAHVWVLTQNVDGFHRRAGSSHIIDIHGDLHNLRCTACSWRRVFEHFEDLGGMPPKCPECGRLVRPEIVLFGEYLPEKAIATLQREVRAGFDAVFSVGTTSVFPYIAAPIHDARRRGRLTVEINPGETSISDDVEIRIRAGAAATLDALWSRYREIRGLGAD